MGRHVVRPLGGVGVERIVLRHQPVEPGSSRSRRAEGSAFSWIVRLADVCRTNRVQSPDSTPVPLARRPVPRLRAVISCSPWCRGEDVQESRSSGSHRRVGSSPGTGRLRVEEARAGLPRRRPETPRSDSSARSPRGFKPKSPSGRVETATVQSLPRTSRGRASGYSKSEWASDATVDLAHTVASTLLAARPA